MNTLLKIIIALALIGFGLLIGLKFGGGLSLFEKEKTENATVLLESINEVTKLITIEGQLSELYDYKDFYSYDISPLRKQAIVRVTANVSVGYNFEKMQVSVKPHLNQIIIRHFPEPEIISIDHELDYYDISEGVFNGFDKDDYNAINKSAKEFIIKEAAKSHLLDKARDRKGTLINMIKAMLSGTGYTLVVEERPALLN